MRIIRGYRQLRAADRGNSVTIGNFDGMHLGHQAILTQLRARARALDLPTLAIIFEPQPLEYFQKSSAPPRLTRLREKLAAIAEAGIERLLLLKFDRWLAAMPPQTFATRILLDGLGARYLLVGDDFRFGQGRAGDFALLRALGAAHGCQVEAIRGVVQDHRRISSTRIRAALAAGELDTAARLLGRPYRMSGRVIHGDQRGRRIGFPTANIHLHRHASPLHGVYAVRVHGLGEPALPGVANLGTRPTVGGGVCRLEVHLFDFNRDLYGSRLEVEFCHKLRDECRFADFNALRAQIAQDARAARALLGV